jgi:type III secretion protein U
MSNKSEEPTESRLRQARQDGQTSKSKDLTQALTACIWTGILVLLFFPAFGAASQILQNMIGLMGTPKLAPDQLIAHAAGELLLPAALMMLGVAIAGVVIAVILEQLQVKGLFSAKPVTPDFNKMNPVKQLKSIFSLKTIVELIKNLLKVTVIVFTTITIIRLYFADALQLFLGPPLDTLIVVAHMLCWLGVCSQGALLMMAMVDIHYQKYEYIKGLKMTKDEVRRDYKQQEGDPHIKGARRQLQAEMANERST